MTKRLCHILLLFAALVILVPSCGRDGARVIPRGRMAKIYAEMFVTDQWILSTPKLRTIADTSLVYEPILEKYGYTSEDYQYSVGHYMNDPERFSRILRTTGEILDTRIKEVQKLQEELARAKEAEAKRKAKKYADFEFPEMQLFHEDIPEDGLWNYSDSIEVAWDTIMNLYRISRLARTDVDTLAVTDTLAVADSLMTAVSVAADSSTMKKGLPRGTFKPAGLKEMSMEAPPAHLLRDSMIRRDFRKSMQKSVPARKE